SGADQGGGHEYSKKAFGGNEKDKKHEKPEAAGKEAGGFKGTESGSDATKSNNGLSGAGASDNTGAFTSRRVDSGSSSSNRRNSSSKRRARRMELRTTLLGKLELNRINVPNHFDKYTSDKKQGDNTYDDKRRESSTRRRSGSYDKSRERDNDKYGDSMSSRDNRQNTSNYKDDNFGSNRKERTSGFGDDTYGSKKEYGSDSQGGNNYGNDTYGSKNNNNSTGRTSSPGRRDYGGSNTYRENENTTDNGMNRLNINDNDDNRGNNDSHFRKMEDNAYTAAENTFGGRDNDSHNKRSGADQDRGHNNSTYGRSAGGYGNY
ncbi:ATP-dependent Lon protease pim1, partial [Ascosphaera pollenicola]